MQVDYTGRQAALTPALRTIAEEGLGRVDTILGKAFSAHVILTAEKYRQIAEVTVQSRQHSLVGLGENHSMETALRDAVGKVETQAKRLKEKLRESKRQPKEEKQVVEAPVRRSGGIVANGKAHAGKGPEGRSEGKILPPRKEPAPAAVVLQAASTVYTEPHVVRCPDPVAARPMTVEEAVKEAECQDKDVFVFRSPSGVVSILHRKRDGMMELIEAS